MYRSEQAEIDFNQLKPDYDKVKACHDQQKAVVTKLSEECTNAEKEQGEIDAVLKEKKYVKMCFYSFLSLTCFSLRDATLISENQLKSSDRGCVAGRDVSMFLLAL